MESQTEGFVGFFAALRTNVSMFLVSFEWTYLSPVKKICEEVITKCKEGTTLRRNINPNYHMNGGGNAYSCI